MAAFIVYQIVKRDPSRHYWIVVLSTAELYGGYVPLCFGKCERLLIIFLSTFLLCTRMCTAG
jgi:hypothetical protein